MQDDYGIHYSYDERGNLAGIQFLDFGYYYDYDDANRLIEAKTHSNPLQKGIGFGYNANGLVEEITTPHNTDVPTLIQTGDVKDSQLK